MGIIGAVIGNIKNIKKANKIQNMECSNLLKQSDEDLYNDIVCFCEYGIFDLDNPILNEEKKVVFCLEKFEAEVNNGGLCQFFVNSSGECAPYISQSLESIGALNIKALYDSFVSENGINVNDLSAFKVSSIDEYNLQTEKYDYDSFDDMFYEDMEFHNLFIKYIRENINLIIK